MKRGYYVLYYKIYFTLTFSSYYETILVSKEREKEQKIVFTEIHSRFDLEMTKRIKI